MGSSRSLWIVTATIGLVTTIILFAGFLLAVREVMFPAPSTADEASNKPAAEERNALADDKIQIVAIGDSLTKGTGDQSGKGYVGHVKEQLAKNTNKPVHVIGNFAVNGYRTDQLLHDLHHVQGVANTLAQANLILFTIGANDLFQFARDQFEMMNDIKVEDIEEKYPEVAERFRQIIDRLHEINPQAVIVYVAIYNPFIDLDDSGKVSAAIQRFNQLAFEHAVNFPHLIVVPTFDLFVNNPTRFLFSDHFHPNQDGYARIGERVAEVLR